MPTRKKSAEVDITPEGSEAPVYLVPAVDEDFPETPSPDEQLAAVAALREEGILKLVSLGLTREQAEAVAGNPSSTL